MKKINVSTVIFDYGNTLVHDPFEDILKLKSKDFQEELKELGYKFKRKDITNRWNKANKDVNYIHISHFAQEEPIIEEALIGLGIKESDVPKISKELLSVYRDGYKQIYLRDPRKKEVQSTLKYLKDNDKGLAVFSNGRTSDVKTAMILYNIYNYFDFILASEEIGKEKPDPLVFETLIKKAKVPPSNILYVGDDPLRDIQASKQSGMKAVLYEPPKKYRKVVPWRNYEDVNIKPDAVITKFSQLKKIIV
jgi:HAD superfamily hydrolase (TIGR01549 family)